MRDVVVQSAGILALAALNGHAALGSKLLLCAGVLCAGVAP